MQVEHLVWLSAGIGLGLFVAMVVLAIFAVGERRHLRRWRRNRVPAPMVDVAAARPSEEPAIAPAPVATEEEPAPAAAVSPSKITAGASTPAQSAAPIPAAERPQLDIEGLFEEAFQSSLKPEGQPEDRPEQKRP